MNFRTLAAGVTLAAVVLTSGCSSKKGDGTVQAASTTAVKDRGDVKKYCTSAKSSNDALTDFQTTFQAGGDVGPKLDALITAAKAVPAPPEVTDAVAKQVEFFTKTKEMLAKTNGDLTKLLADEAFQKLAGDITYQQASSDLDAFNSLNCGFAAPAPNASTESTSG